MTTKAEKSDDGKVRGRFLLKLSGEAFSGAEAWASIPTWCTPSPVRSRPSYGTARRSRS